MTYRVLILEDDPMVAAIDRQYVESDRHFQVVQVCKSGGQALEYLAHQDVELIVLDYYTPEMNGQEFLDPACHGAGSGGDHGHLGQRYRYCALSAQPGSAGLSGQAL